MIPAAILAQLADAATYLAMGADREANPLVVTLAGHAWWLPLAAKVALVVYIVAFAAIAPRLGRRVAAVALVVGAIGAGSNVWTIVG